MNYINKIYLYIKWLILFLPLCSQSQVPFPGPGEVFSDELIPRIDILIPEDSLAAIFDPKNLESDHHYPATFIFDNGTVRDTLEQVGFRLRGNTSRYSDKKSFKVSFNTFVPGRKYRGLEKLNLNGEHNDPSVIRSKICWDLLYEMGVPASRANHIDLYVNGFYFGLYIHVEHVDEEFVDLRFGSQDGNLYKCLWPADLNYLGSNPDLYKLKSGGRRVYDLMTNQEEDDYSDLAHFIDVLNNTSLWDLPCELDQVIHIDRMIRAIAFDILSGNWDGPHYNKNNFYLYHNPYSGKFEYIPYDLDNTLGIDWLNQDWGTRNIYNWGKQGEPRPLFYKFLSHPEHRNRLSYYLQLFGDEIFNEDHLFPRIDQIRSMITNSVIEDPFRPQDYGFSFQDFLNSYNQPLDEFHVQYGLKPYISTRLNSALAQLDPDNISPILTDLWVEMDDAGLKARVYAMDDVGVSSVNVCFSPDQSAYSCFELFDNGMWPDEQAGDGIYCAYFPEMAFTGNFYFYAEAIDKTGLDYREPICTDRVHSFGLSGNSLFINEILADNSAIIKDEFGDFDDWIEIYNGGDETIFLGDKYLTDDRFTPEKWKMPNDYIEPGEFRLIWADDQLEQGEWHAGFRLSKDGEFIGLYDFIEGELVLLDGFDFSEMEKDVSFGRLPDGSGLFTSLSPTPNGPNQALYVTQVENTAWEIFPNPAFSKITIKWSYAGIEVSDVYLVNILGNRSFQPPFDCSKDKLVLETADLPPGPYLLQVFSDDAVFTGKILITQ